MKFKKEKVKISRHNVFEILDGESSHIVKDLDKRTIKAIKKANKKKRKKDDSISLKNNEDYIIECTNVSKYYLSGTTATKVLRDIDFKVKKGEIIVIFGKSGSGKSTLLNLISGLDRPSKGNVVVADTNLPYLSDNELTKFRRENVSFIFQNYNLLQNINGYDNVETGAYLNKSKPTKERIEELFKVYEVDGVMDKYPSQMSGGQQQRISILRALIKDSQIIFADEPTGALDEATTRIVLTSLFEENKAKNTTIVMVSHNPAIEPMADRIVFVKEGKITGIKHNQNPVHPKDLGQL
ncbi:ABC transporter ATP-binding protein [Mycoplasma sp. Ms02]|uniref:ABC transporter ATP-binding protein n=1 Tax=Mycoplasma sp. Ms02 TaxID=353851 RepID=UPI001C899E3E|nr:ABC transporter ATP-binding protein [Mycoplasma sp. Ms02]QZE12066.1 ABC transporter ATP-binding protein [Mycoplasma sp. Ms02]